MFWFKNHKRPRFIDKSSPSHNFKERKSDRFNFETPIVFESYDTGEVFRGSAINYGKGGLYIEAEHRPEEGTGAIVHMAEYSPWASGPNNLQKYYVQVKWIKHKPGTTNHNRYGIGVKNCDDIHELFRLFGH